MISSFYRLIILLLLRVLLSIVDNESSLHHEEDPRYRGGAIPSRAFRFLQTMTESGDAPAVNTSKFFTFQSIDKLREKVVQIVKTRLWKL